MDKIPYRVVRSNRRSVSMEITPGLEVLVRAPKLMPQAMIESFVERHRDWAEAHLARAKERASRLPPEPTEEEKQELIRRAKALLPERVAHYGVIMGLTPTGITVTGAQKRFGSCSGKNRLCFSWRLMRYPQEAIDYVVVHELAHIRHKDHGKAFYALIATVLPDYKEREALLR